MTFTDDDQEAQHAAREAQRGHDLAAAERYANERRALEVEIDGLRERVGGFADLPVAAAHSQLEGEIATRFDVRVELARKQRDREMVYASEVASRAAARVKEHEDGETTASVE
jgi:hypothetical protein